MLGGRRKASGGLAGFKGSIETAFDQLGFTNEFVTRKIADFGKRKLSSTQIDESASSVAKVVKDIIWGMIEVDDVTVSILDTPFLQRLRYIRQNGFTYLVYPSASHTRLEHSLGVLAVASRYITSINSSRARPGRLAKGLVTHGVSPKLALDLKHAAILHDIGHFPFSHVLESIFESAPDFFSIGASSVRDFEICFMDKLRNIKSRLSEKLSVAIILSPRFKNFYTALREDEWAYLRVACLVSGMPLDDNTPGYSQLISGAVDCDKVDYLLRDSAMCNVPVAIDQARLFLNSALIQCESDTIQKLINRGVLGLDSANLQKPALILVLNSSGVDSIEEVAFARATLYERVYRHAVTRNAERLLAVAISDAAERLDPATNWQDILCAFALTDDTFLEQVSRAGAKSSATLALKLRHRDLPKRAFAFSPDFYTPVVPYMTIFSGMGDKEAQSNYYHEVISKDPFHEIVQGLKESSPIFRSNQTHRELERRITTKSNSLAQSLRRLGEKGIPKGNAPEVFFIPLPDHSSTPSSCAIVTREGELESSGDYSRAHQLVSAKEIGRSIGFVTCDPGWAEIVFLASQEVLYDYFGDEIGSMDLDLEFNNSAKAGQNTSTEEHQHIRVGVIKRFYIADELATRRCRLDRSRLTHYRKTLSHSTYYNKRPRLAESAYLTSDVIKIAGMFKEFSGQHGWHVTKDTVQQFLNQFPTSLRSEARKLLISLRFLDRSKTSKLLKNAVESVLSEIERKPVTARAVKHIVPLAGTSAHMALELFKQEYWSDLKTSSIRIARSVHDMLGVAQAGDVAIFVDDNIGSGTQFSAQLLKWIGRLDQSKDDRLKNERGIEFLELDKNQQGLLKSLEIWLSTCVGNDEAESKVRSHLKNDIRFRGIRFSQKLEGTHSENEFRKRRNSPPKGRQEAGEDEALLNFLGAVGAECLRHCRGLQSVTPQCRVDALGYGNLRGRTITLWNVPTSTLTALWCPGVVDGEPWFPLFIRRGYVDNLVVA